MASSPNSISGPGLEGSASTAAAAPYITALKPNDVLLGRGRPTVRFQGNIRFRKLIQNRMKEYTSTCRHVSKDAIAQEVVEMIIARDGQFLRKVELSAEFQELGLPQGVEAWIRVDRQAAINKVKQAFRDEKRATSESQDDAIDNVAESNSSRSPAAAAEGTASSDPSASIQNFLSLQNQSTGSELGTGRPSQQVHSGFQMHQDPLGGPTQVDILRRLLQVNPNAGQFLHLSILEQMAQSNRAAPQQISAQQLQAIASEMESRRRQNDELQTLLTQAAALQSMPSFSGSSVEQQILAAAIAAQQNGSMFSPSHRLNSEPRHPHMNSPLCQLPTIAPSQQFAVANNRAQFLPPRIPAADGAVPVSLSNVVAERARLAEDALWRYRASLGSRDDHDSENPETNKAKGEVGASMPVTESNSVKSSAGSSTSNDGEKKPAAAARR